MTVGDVARQFAGVGKGRRGGSSVPSPAARARAPPSRVVGVVVTTVMATPHRMDTDEMTAK
jgi:hypothetical protein